MPADVNLIQRGELQGRLVRGLGIRERAPAPVLATEVVPVVLLEDLVNRVDPLVEREAAGIITRGLVAAEFQSIAMGRAGAPGYTAHFYGLVFSLSTVTDIWIARITTQPNTAGTASQRYFMDSDVSGEPATLPFSQSAVGRLFPTSAAFMFMRVPSNTTLIVPISVTLHNGEFLAIEGNLQNTTITCTFFWRERFPTT